jgi:hypothetical protein
MVVATFKAPAESVNAQASARLLTESDTAEEWVTVIPELFRQMLSHDVVPPIPPSCVAGFPSNLKYPRGLGLYLNHLAHVTTASPDVERLRRRGLEINRGLAARLPDDLG